jgi:glycosyltransferase involved in cell wall biosynthesis
MRRLLWVGDAVVATGFAKCTHKTLDVLRKDWDVHVLGLNYDGDPHEYPYDIYPAWVPGKDVWGTGRLALLLNHLRPDVCIVQNDPWNVPEYMKKTGNCPVVATMPVDGKNCRGGALNGLAHAIWWTEFGKHEAALGGYQGPSSVIPLGVDLQMYKSGGDGKRLRTELRKHRGVPEDAFIIGNVNRNQPRKRLDLSIRYFAKWVEQNKIEDAYLFLHVAPTGDQGYDVSQLAEYYGVSNKLIIVEPSIGHGVSEEALASAYQIFDLMITTTQGEGWGLTTMEGMASGVPQIVPDWSALGEWIPDDCAIKVPCTSTIVTPTGINVVGGIADEERFIEALQTMYVTATMANYKSEQCHENALALVAQDQFRWENIGQRFAEVLDGLRKPSMSMTSLELPKEE